MIIKWLYFIITQKKIFESNANNYRGKITENNKAIIECDALIAHTNWIQRGCLLGLLPIPAIPIWAVVPIGIYIKTRHSNNNSLYSDYSYREELGDPVS